MRQQQVPEKTIQKIIGQTKISLKNYAQYIEKTVNEDNQDWPELIKKTHALKGSLSVFSAFEDPLLTPYTQNITKLYAAAKEQDLGRFMEQFQLFYDEGLKEFLATI